VRSLPGGDHVGDWQRGAAVACVAVGVQLVIMGVRAGNAAQVDHGHTVLIGQAHRMSLVSEYIPQTDCRFPRTVAERATHTIEASAPQ